MRGCFCPAPAETRSARVEDDGVTSRNDAEVTQETCDHLGERAGARVGGQGGGSLDPERTFKVILKVTRGPDRARRVRGLAGVGTQQTRVI